LAQTRVPISRGAGSFTTRANPDSAAIPTGTLILEPKSPSGQKVI